MDNNKKNCDCQFSVYAIWCKITGMYYVGVTRQPVTTRIREHRRGKQFIDKEIKKIGWEGNWDWWILEENIPAENIDEREKFWIDCFDCVHPKGYNKTHGGIGNIEVTDEARQKIRERALERDLSGERNPMYGRTHSDEVKAAQSERMKGKNNPNYGKSPANKGVPHTAEEKAKISAAVKGENNPFYGKHHTEEAKEKNRQAHIGKPGNRKGKHHTEKAKAILREKALERDMSGERNPFYGKHHTPETIEKNRQANSGENNPMYGKHHSEASREKMSASAKERWAKEKAAAEAAAAQENLAAQENADNQITP